MLKKLSTLLITLIMTGTLTACGTGTSSNVSEQPNPTAIMETSMGKIVLEVFLNEIPQLSTNFIELAKAGKYNNTVFHRVIKDFMIQGGDFENGNGTGGYSYKGPGTELPGEYNAAVSSNLRGTVAMANKGPGTNGSQFFINVKDNTFLDHDKQPLTSQHPVFAKVIKGMDVVDKISNVQTLPGDRPVTEVRILSVTIE